MGKEVGEKHLITTRLSGKPAFPVLTDDRRSASGTTAGPALPPGWKEVPTPKDNEYFKTNPVYYHHAERNAIRWEKPTAASDRLYRDSLVSSPIVEPEPVVRRVSGPRRLVSNRRCDSPVLLRLLEEIYRANGLM